MIDGTCNMPCPGLHDQVTKVSKSWAVSSGNVRTLGLNETFLVDALSRVKVVEQRSVQLIIAIPF
jgi:hypothetical protein